MSTRDESAPPRMAIFRGQDAIDFDAAGIMSHAAPSPVEADGAQKAVEAGMLEGADNRLLFAAPGFSLVHVWFKSGFPLPRHSHDVGCLYYILAGSLDIGNETLSQGDGFFVAADVPYAYIPGPNGVELLEFRASNAFGIRMMADNPAFWTKAVAQTLSHREAWASEPRPTMRHDDRQGAGAVTDRE